MMISSESFEMCKLLYAFLFFNNMCLIIATLVLDAFRSGIRSWGSGRLFLSFIGIITGMIPVATITVAYLHVILFTAGHVSEGVVTSTFSLVSYAIFYNSYFCGRLFARS